MTETDRVDKLVLSYLKGTLDEGEKAGFLEWLEQDPANLKYFSEIKAVYNHIEAAPHVTMRTLKAELRRLNAAIDRRQPRPASRRFFFPAVAAACIVAFAIVGLVRYGCCTPDLKTYVAEDHGMTEIELEDGTHVWLKPHSILSYDAEGFMDERNVEFVGEAVFDVAHNPASPFVVSAPGIKVKVLGTIFRICNFSENEPAEAVLAEGSIELMNREGDYLVTLNPGQRATYDSEVLQIKDVMIDDVAMIRYGIRIIREAPLRDIVRELERDFDIRLRAVSYTLKDTLFTISYVKDADVKDVLELLEAISGSKFQIEE